MKITRKVIIPVMLACGAILGLFRFMGAAALAAEKEVDNQTIILWGAFGPAEIQNTLEAFSTQTGVSTNYIQVDGLNNAVKSCEPGVDCPEIAIVPNPGVIRDLVEKNAILPLDTILTDFDTYYTSTYRTLGSVNGDLYGLPVGLNSKSMVWYRPDALASISASTPSDWESLLSLADALVADGQTPFSIGVVSNGASGWPMTDIFENVLLRTAGPDVHRMLAKHEVTWTDPRVVAALEKTSDILGVDPYQVGGITGTRTTTFSEAINNVFGDPPSGAMYFGATFVANLLPGLTPEVDYNYFDFPSIDPAHGKPFLGAGDFAILFSESEDAKSFIQFLATPEAGELWVTASPGHISPNMGVDPLSYTNSLIRDLAQDLVVADEYLFDLDDQLPSALQMYVWGAMMDFLENQDQAENILAGIESEAIKHQGAVYTVYLPLTKR